MAEFSFAIIPSSDLVPCGEGSGINGGSTVHAEKDHKEIQQCP